MLGTSPLTRKAGLIDLAFDRLGWVRVVTHRDATRYELVGIARRRPKTCTVSTATAAALVAAGLPTVVSRCDACDDST